MKRFKDLIEEVLEEGSYEYPGDEMTQKELKIAINAAKNILDMIGDGAMVQRWQISAIVKASEELASVCTSMRADEEEEDEYEDEYDEAPMYVGFEYPSMYGESFGGLFKNASEWESSAKARGLVVKSMTHPSGEMTKYQIAKDKQGNNRGHFDHGIKSGQLHEVSDKKLDAYRQKAFADQPAGDDGSDKYRKRKFGRDLAFAKQTGRAKVLATKEEIELDEQKMTFQDAEKLKSKHLAAMQHHKKNGNSKGYAAHSMVVDKFEDAYDRHGTSVIPVGRIVSASQKAFKDHPHSSIKEELDFKVSVDGLPDMYVKANSTSEVKANLRKVIKKPDSIQSVDRVTQAMLKKIFRDKSMGKEEIEEDSEVDESSFVAKAAHAKVAGQKTFKLKGGYKEHPVTIKHHHAKKIKQNIEESRIPPQLIKDLKHLGNYVTHFDPTDKGYGIGFKTRVGKDELARLLKVNAYDIEDDTGFSPSADPKNAPKFYYHIREDLNETHYVKQVYLGKGKSDWAVIPKGSVKPEKVFSSKEDAEAHIRGKK
jgi:hypothetical protein